MNAQQISVGVDRDSRMTEPEARSPLSPVSQVSPLSDEELLEALASDPAALGILYDRHATLVYGLALAMLGAPEEAEDLTQEIFVTICGPRVRDYDRGRGTVAAFLITMTRSRALDRLRRRTRSARLLTTWHDAAAPAAAAANPFEDVWTQRAAARVRAVLAELPDAQREVLVLAYYRGLTQSEIAAELGTPLGTVKSRLRRALLALGEALDDLSD
jgi:RNA polymerase sigma-70 factor, ECF subfamily